LLCFIEVSHYSRIKELETCIEVTQTFCWEIEEWRWNRSFTDVCPGKRLIVTDNMGGAVTSYIM
jgi:hypothetical protein